MLNKKKSIATWILFLLCSTQCFATDWDYQYWQAIQWTQWKKERCKLYFNAQLRFTDDWRHFTFYRLTEAFAYSLLDDLDLEIHYSYINSKSAANPHFTYAHRIELEANPTLKLPHGIDIQWRNRLELIKEENRKHILYVIRERFRIIFPIKNCRKLTALKIGNEVFYNLSTKYFVQNRFWPLILTFSLSKRTSLDLYVMIRNNFSNETWNREFVLGTDLSF